jgi:outer membrane lipoprotein-sorting protein
MYFQDMDIWREHMVGTGYAAGLLRAAGAVACMLLATTAPSNAAPDKASYAAAQRIADHFSSVISLKGRFVQFNPSGRQQSGTFTIQRPGRVRFDYAGSPLRVIADGSQVAINNKKLNTWDLYPLSKTPLKLLLGKSIDLSAANVRSVKEGADVVTIVLGDKSVFGDSMITLVFDARTYDVRQWTIRDQQGKDTTVVVDAATEGGKVDPALFRIPYTAISQGQTGNKR